MEEGGWQVPSGGGGWLAGTAGGGGRLAGTGGGGGGGRLAGIYRWRGRREAGKYREESCVSILVLWSLVVVVLVHYWCRFVWLVVLVVVLFLFEVVSVDDVHVAVECLGLLHHCNVHV